MTVHLLYDPNRPVENITWYNEMKRHDITCQLWPCIADGNNVVRSINISHKQIVQHAKETGMDKICILEEDIWFPAPDGWKYFLANEPPEYDLYLGGTYGLNLSALSRISGESQAAEIHNFAGLHCYIIHSRYYDKFLALPEKDHIDHQPGMGKFMVCYPFAAVQYKGWSSNNRQKHVDYNELIKDHIYYGKANNIHCGDR